MSEKIDELLVGLGMDIDDRSFQQAQSNFNGVRSAALQFMGAIGSGIGFDALTRQFAASNDQLGKFANTLGVAPELVDSLGYALERSGGQASDAYASIQNMQSLFDDFYRGETGRFDAAAIYGFDPRTILEAENIADAYERLADATQNMGTDQRRRVLQALGLGSTAEITLFEGGSDALRDYFSEAQRLAPMTREMTQVASDFNDEMSRTTRSLKGISDEISLQLLPGLIDFSTWVRTFAEENRGLITEFVTEGPEAVGRRYGEQVREWVSNRVDERAPWLSELIGRADTATDTKAQDALDIVKRWWGQASMPEATNVSRETLPPLVETPSANAQQSQPFFEALLDAVKQVESSGQHRDPATGELTRNARSGARGAYQIMDATARDPGFGVQPLQNDTEEEHRRFAGDYLGALVSHFDDVEKALAAYNWGVGNVARYGDNWREMAPSETRAYVPKVRDALNATEAMRDGFSSAAASELASPVGNTLPDTTADMPTGALLPDELNYTPSQRELIPESGPAELQQGNRALMREYFPEQYEGAQTNITISINGANDPRAVAAEVQRVLRQSAETSARDFYSSIT